MLKYLYETQKYVWVVKYSPRRAGELSPLRSRSMSACRELVWRTPDVYSEFMTARLYLFVNNEKWYRTNRTQN